jgi:hypothetical protein
MRCVMMEQVAYLAILNGFECGGVVGRGGLNSLRAPFTTTHSSHLVNQFDTRTFKPDHHNHHSKENES